MKTIICWGILLWLGLVLENSRGDVFSSGSLIIPLAVGCLFWLRNSGGVLLAGAALIMRWLLEPASAPVEVFVVLLLSCWQLSRKQPSAVDVVSKRPPQWLMPIWVTMAGVFCHAMMLTPSNSAALIQDILSKSLIALPAIGGVVFAGRVADELGLRRVSV